MARKMPGKDLYGGAVRPGREIALTVAGLTVTSAAGVLLAYEIVNFAAAGIRIGSARAVVEQA
ncbi:MAG: hypothetical protein OEM67_07375, partial [Thermoleophilia bacterium]|nr:hypothetical protein [Thermoleophilia bacterium]